MKINVPLEHYLPNYNIYFYLEVHDCKNKNVIHVFILRNI